MKLRHERILKCLGMFTRGQHLYLVSPFMKNGSLFDLVSSGSPNGLQRLRLVSRARKMYQIDGLVRDLNLE